MVKKFFYLGCFLLHHDPLPSLQAMKSRRYILEEVAATNQHPTSETSMFHIPLQILCLKLWTRKESSTTGRKFLE